MTAASAAYLNIALEPTASSFGSAALRLRLRRRLTAGVRCSRPRREKMFDAVKDVITIGALRSFEDLLWEWTSVIERVVRVWYQDDVPWWYNERASLSLFAGAIWKVGGIAFEEF